MNSTSPLPRSGSSGPGRRPCTCSTSPAMRCDGGGWAGGDLINGTIHEELEERTSGPTEAILYVQNQVAAGLDLLIKKAKVDQLTVVTSFGNHGRTTRKRRKHFTGYRHNWEWLAYQNLRTTTVGNPKSHLKSNRDTTTGYRSRGTMRRFHHGDAIHYGGGVGGVTIPLKKKIAQWNKWHRAVGRARSLSSVWTACMDVVCGAPVGYDAYVLEIGV